MRSSAEAHKLMSRPIRVLVDARMLIGRFSGVARVVTRLVEQLARRDDIHVIALCGSEPYAPWSTRADIEVIRSSFARHHRTPGPRWRWEQANLSCVIAEANADVYHATWNSGIPRNASVPCVLTIHDLIPWAEPKVDFSSAVQAWRYRRAVRASARRADHVTTVSEHVRADVIARLRSSPNRVVCVPNGVDVPSIRAEADPAEPPYVLYVGGHEPRKNLAGLFVAIQRYWEREGMTLELRLTGRPETLSAHAREAYRRLPADAPVRFLGDINDDDLSRQYRSARALLLLSKAEGFGLPVLEAMAHRCPVIASARGALPEVVGDAGLLVNPDGPAQVVAAISSLISTSHLREDLIARGVHRAAMFSWSQTAESLVEVYQEALSRHAFRTAPFVPNLQSRQVALTPS